MPFAPLLARTPRRAFLCAALLALPLALPRALATPAHAERVKPGEPRGALRTLLNGSFFPFARSFPPPSKRCQKLAAKRRAARDDNTLTQQDLVELRFKGCGGASAF